MKQKMALVFGLLLLFSFLSIGALGLKFKSDCDSLSSFSEQLKCYHEAAVSYATLGDSSTAVDMCDSISFLSTSTDNEKDAQLETANFCYEDISKIVAEYNSNYASSICDNIEENIFSSSLTGGGRRENCKLHVKEIGYSNANVQNNLCSILLIFPLLIFFMFYKKPDKQYA